MQVFPSLTLPGWTPVDDILRNTVTKQIILFEGSKLFAGPPRFERGTQIYEAGKMPFLYFAGEWATKKAESRISELPVRQRTAGRRS